MATTTATPVQVFKATEEAVDGLQNATLAATNELFDVWSQAVRSQQQLIEAEIKFWFKLSSSQFPR
ncbi:MAG: hypothetical protein EXR48_06265 [Dehalococcoidia bacterium]|nr:hypothetical protein [Dehalococcoidia bacterium]